MILFLHIIGFSYLQSHPGLTGIFKTQKITYKYKNCAFLKYGNQASLGGKRKRINYVDVQPFWVVISFYDPFKNLDFKFLFYWQKDGKAPLMSEASPEVAPSKYFPKISLHWIRIKTLRGRLKQVKLKPELFSTCCWCFQTSKLTIFIWTSILHSV